MNSFDLHRLHVRTCDTLTAKAGNSTRMNYCAYLEIAKSRKHLKLHFMSFGAMSSVINLILEAQGFESRLAQFEHV